MDLLQPLFLLPRPVRFPALTYSVLLLGRPYKNYNSPTDYLIPSIFSACSSQPQAPSGQGYVVPLTALVWIPSHVCGPNEHCFPFPHITKSFPHSMAQGQCLLLSVLPKVLPLLSHHSPRIALHHGVLSGSTSHLPLRI